MLSGLGGEGHRRWPSPPTLAESGAGMLKFFTHSCHSRLILNDGTLLRCDELRKPWYSESAYLLGRNF